MKKQLLWIFLLSIAACSPQPALPPPLQSTPPPTILQIGVADSATAVIDLITTNDVLDNPGAMFQFVVGANDTLFADLQAGQLDAVIGHIIPEDAAYWTNPIALDGVAAVVHPTNSVTNLTRGELQAIFNGRITNWSAVGGADMPITLVSRPRDAGSHQLFSKRVMQSQRININAQVQPTDAALLQAVATNEGAIGFSMMGNSQAASVSMLTIDGYLPTVVETAVQSYPLTVPLYFIHADANEPTGELRALVAWIQSVDGQAQIGLRYGRVR